MSLDYAILGFLSYRPFSGYDLKKAFDGTVRHFWPADRSQIYRTLARLLEAGWLEVDLIPQKGRPNRKLYSITEAGRSALQRWLTGDAIRLEPRDAFLAQLFFAGRLSDEEAIRLLETRAEGLRSLIEEYGRQADDGSAEGLSALSAREQFFWYLTLDSGFHVLQARLQWTESAIEKIRSGAYVRGRDGALTHRRAS